MSYFGDPRIERVPLIRRKDRLYLRGAVLGLGAGPDHRGRLTLCRQGARKLAGDLHKPPRPSASIGPSPGCAPCVPRLISGHTTGDVVL